MELEDQWIKLCSTNIYTRTTHNTVKHVNATNLSFYRSAVQGMHLIDIRNINTVKCKCIMHFCDPIYHKFLVLAPVKKS